MTFRFDLGDLQAFLAVAETRHFGKAAEIMHLSQPALSRRVEKLERVLDVRLLERTTRAVKLTTIGREFAHNAAQLIKGLDNALFNMSDFAGARSGTINVACIPSAAHYFLVEIIRRYHAAYPNIRINVIDVTVGEVLSAVIEREADFGVTFLSTHEPDIDFSPIKKDKFVLACHRDHALATKRSVKWSQLGAYDFIALNKKSSTNRLLIEHALVATADRPTAIYQAQHLTTLIGMVEAGLGIAAVPAIAMPSVDHPVLVSIPLTNPTIVRTIGLIRRRGHALSPAAAKLYDMVYAGRYTPATQ